MPQAASIEGAMPSPRRLPQVRRGRLPEPGQGFSTLLLTPHPGEQQHLRKQSVGSELTPTQQDEVLEDLGFFLDNFGSTYAVRVTLQRRAKKKKTATSAYRTMNRLETITMADLDFFLRTFESTRAVREKLQSQRREVVGLQRALQWLQERRGTMNESSGPSESQNNIQELQVEEIDCKKRNCGEKMGVSGSSEPHEHQSTLPWHRARPNRKEPSNFRDDGE
ncbi:hypothetical protein PHYSODRAFT_338833 [Phytophthora sojae]|uniref:Uncharacterized protein n=1 Tax=Phytophthora sojae (strain P6497) TaxID=1094619 RepID=G5A3A9_PHYSP|nr:hypothetical protein PHYSODRAFT_338833 [Phytophthora sojae]EGZ10149.1 hypothetical protein PHYSODRAFT_338833 [Phytophthora sojae]|eukprot:XP_009535010.1 hypothetical protein PHYSODRAFT_338833 [Phytophthora sojae]